MFFKCSDKRIELIGDRAVNLILKADLLIDIPELYNIKCMIKKDIAWGTMHEIFFYWRWNPFFITLAKSDVNGTKMWINTKYMPTDEAELGGLIAHELAHNLGFVHQGNLPTEANKLTVPWVLGKWVRDNYRRV